MKWYWILAAGVVVASVLLHASRIVRFDTSLHWTAWVVVGLVLLSGGWMAFDGGRGLVVGDYFTPATGPHAGRLGPWSKVVEAVGIEPRSTLMKSIFLVYGLAFLAAAAALVTGASWGWWGALILAVLGLWYLPFGTLFNGIVIALLLSPPLRGAGG